MKIDVRIRITGRNPRLFIKRFIIKQKINYYNYCMINYNQVELNISYKDYVKLLEKNSIYDILVVKTYGPIAFINYIKNNFSLMIFLSTFKISANKISILLN